MTDHQTAAAPAPCGLADAATARPRGAVMDSAREHRYFATVHADTRQTMVDLASFHFDLFQATARADGTGGAIDGLLTLDEVARLVDAGYRVTVEAPDTARSRARQTSTFADWLEGMSE